ncbi:hypothetical protein OIU91_35580 [Streptomyces sp. NBC_01456]|uniref:hypothetical protein n=1 Tax=unclassified Streptomyces TaxID=2593676 RepID=UPI002E314886|nr:MULTISPECIES: hypothetical protein [unclassified Streptomyces]
MRYFDGTPAEIAEFLRLTGTAEHDAQEPDVFAAEEADVGTVAQSPDGPQWLEIERHVNGRGRDADTTRRVLGYLRQVLDLNVEIATGTSIRTKDGLTDYVMVRDAGKRRFGAVTYVGATNGGLTLRLTENDVADVVDHHIGIRDVRPDHKYVVTCPLKDDEAIALALKLTERALAKVRS